ncbi:MAG: transposase [Endomicrobium sp.]|nr:transposase [Endomicrobium sp.]
MGSKASAYALIGVDIDGKKEVMGLYIGISESTKYWLSDLTFF